MTKKSYTAGHFELQIDGHPSTAYLKSVDGGFVRANVVEEPIGPENLRIKHTSTVEIEPMTLNFGLSGAHGVLQWIQSSWRKDPVRRNGQITHANFDLERMHEHEFSDALITETTFPTLDGGSTEPAYLKVKLQPERIVSKKARGGYLQSKLGSKQKMWMSCAFRLNIDGLHGLEFTNRLESFTITQDVQKHHTGDLRFPLIEPVGLQFPNLTGTIGLEYADSLLAWYDQYVMIGQADPRAQKTGSLEFLTPDRAFTLFQIDLYEVGLPYLQIVQSTANDTTIKRVKFELYVGRMDLDHSALGMDYF